MPELPEVETICRRLRASCLGAHITDARVLWRRTLATPAPQRFRARIRGQSVRTVDRRGKFVLLGLSRDWLVIHLRMSGRICLERNRPTLPAHTRLVLRLRGGQRMLLRDPRKFGRVWLTSDPAELLAPLGPEPLDARLTADAFHARLSGHRRQLKTLLLDQTFLAGLGNIYVDESLHRAGLHPRRRSSAVTGSEARRLWRSIRQVLRAAIRCNGTSFDAVYGGGDFQRCLWVYGRAGQPCRRCRTPILRTVVGQRGTHYCPHCQPLAPARATQRRTRSQP